MKDVERLQISSFCIQSVWPQQVRINLRWQGHVNEQVFFRTSHPKLRSWHLVRQHTLTHCLIVFRLCSGVHSAIADRSRTHWYTLEYSVCSLVVMQSRARDKLFRPDLQVQLFSFI